MKDLIAQVKDEPPDGGMFPKTKSSRRDMVELGTAIKARKEELLAAGCCLKFRFCKSSPRGHPAAVSRLAGLFYAGGSEPKLNPSPNTRSET